MCQRRNDAEITYAFTCHSIIRILFIVPVYSVVAWLSMLFYNESVYFEVIGNCYEAFCIAAFFSLICHYIAPDLHNQKDYFRGIAPKAWLWPLTWFQRWKCCGANRGGWRNPRSGLTWFNVRDPRVYGISDNNLMRLSSPPFSLDCLGWRVSILCDKGADDHCRRRYAICREILRRVAKPRFCTFLGIYLIPFFARGCLNSDMVP